MLNWDFCFWFVLILLLLLLLVVFHPFSFIGFVAVAFWFIFMHLKLTVVYIKFLLYHFIYNVGPYTSEILFILYPSLHSFIDICLLLAML